MKKIHLFLIVILFILMLAGCKTTESVQFPKDYFQVELEERYPIDEDIQVKISIGFSKDYQKNYSQLKGFKYKLGCFLEYAVYESEVAILYTITDFTDDRYYYTEIGDEIIFNFSEWFTLNKEIFNSEQGYFYIALYQVFQHQELENSGVMYWERIVYKKKNGNLYLQEKHRGDYDSE